MGTRASRVHDDVAALYYCVRSCVLCCEREVCGGVAVCYVIVGDLDH